MRFAKKILPETIIKNLHVKIVYTVHLNGAQKHKKLDTRGDFWQVKYLYNN